jgi:hypothetical protein
VITEMVGDALELQASAQGGNDILTGSPVFGTRTTMYGDGISFYGPARGGSDQLISGASDDFMYGDYQFAFPAPFATDPFIFDIYDQFGFFAPPQSGTQPFTYDPIIFDIFNQNVGGNGPGEATANSKKLTFDDGTVFVIPERGTDGTAPKGGADRFVFKTLDEGSDTIFDFNPAEGDRIVFTNGITLADIQAFENGRDTRINFGNSTILIPFFTGLKSGDILFNTNGIPPIDNGNFEPIAL